MADKKKRRTTIRKGALSLDPPKRGRPPKIPDPAIVEGLARLGCINTEIATVLGMTDETLVKHSSDALKRGRAHRKVSLRRTLDEWTTKNVAAMIFVAKNDLQMSDNIKHEVTGKDGGALSMESIVYIVEVPDNGRSSGG